MRVDVSDSQSYESFCNRVAKALCHIRSIAIGLEGDIGVGKTYFVRSVLNQMGIVEAIKSPSYTLIEHYETSSQKFCHIDCYRLSQFDELELIGFDEAQNGAVTFIEWANQISGLSCMIDLSIEFCDHPKRCLTIDARSQIGATFLESIYQS